MWANRIHSVSWWTGVVGALVVLANSIFGTTIPADQVVSFAVIVLSLVLGGHYVAAKAAQAPATPATPAMSTSTQKVNTVA